MTLYVLISFASNILTYWIATLNAKRHTARTLDRIKRQRQGAKTFYGH